MEVVAASALLWRFRRARADATEEEYSAAERRALYVVSGTFFVLAAYIGVDAITALASKEAPDISTVGIGLAIVSLVVMPTLAYAKQQTGRALGSRALEADAIETWVCAYLSLALLAGVGLHAALGWWWADPLGAARDASGDRLARMGDVGGSERRRLARNPPRHNRSRGEHPTKRSRTCALSQSST
ncbi:MAG: cation diffusion facilitator family transporter [Gaiellaceae bacterium]